MTLDAVKSLSGFLEPDPTKIGSEIGLDGASTSIPTVEPIVTTQGNYMFKQFGPYVVPVSAAKP